VFLRGVLFVAWAVIGAVAGYGLIYAFSVYGLVILGVCLAMGVAIPKAGDSRMPEILGVLAGPGVFCFVVAASGVDDPVWWAGAGALIVGSALVAYMLAGRARSARSA
jgi:prepilin signal peptidase PulO-like enzyme (type II secretory pathway)